MFNPRLMRLARSLVPHGLYRKLDPFEAAIKDFVRDVAAELSDGERILDAGAGESRFKAFSGHASSPKVGRAVSGKLKNRLSIAESYFRHKAVLAGGPIEIILESTAKCNLYCPMCPRHIL